MHGFSSVIVPGPRLPGGPRSAALLGGGFRLQGWEGEEQAHEPHLVSADEPDVLSVGDEEEEQDSDAGDEANAGLHIDPNIIKGQTDLAKHNATCAVCRFVVEQATSCCPQGHSFCYTCIKRWLRTKNECPICRYKTGTEDLVRSIPFLIWSPESGKMVLLETSMADFFAMRNDYGGLLILNGVVYMVQVRSRLGQGFVDEFEISCSENASAGLPQQLASAWARMGQPKACDWMGPIGKFRVHQLECGWKEVPCPNEGCSERHLRMDAETHILNCKHSPPAALGTAMVKTRDPTMLPEMLFMWPNPRLEIPTLKPKPEARNPEPDNRNPTSEPP